MDKEFVWGDQVIPSLVSTFFPLTTDIWCFWGRKKVLLGTLPTTTIAHVTCLNVECQKKNRKLPHNLAQWCKHTPHLLLTCWLGGWGLFVPLHTVEVQITQKQGLWGQAGWCVRAPPPHYPPGMGQSSGKSQPLQLENVCLFCLRNDASGFFWLLDRECGFPPALSRDKAWKLPSSPKWHAFVHVLKQLDPQMLNISTIPFTLVWLFQLMLAVDLAYGI